MTAFFARQCCLECVGTSGFTTRLVTNSTPAEASIGFGCVFLTGATSLTLGTRLARAEGSGFCVALGLSAWATIPGIRGFEVFGANAIAGGCGREWKFGRRAHVRQVRNGK